MRISHMMLLQKNKNVKWDQKLNTNIYFHNFKKIYSTVFRLLAFRITDNFS